MKDVGGLAAALASEALSLATCFRVIRLDGAVFCFTDCDVPLIVGGELYAAASGFRRTASSASASASVDNLDVDGLLDSDAITEADVRRGLWDYATVRMFAVDPTAPDTGRIRVLRGWLGEITTSDTVQFRAELRSLAQAPQQRVGRTYGAECWAELGDEFCTVDVSLDTESGAIAGTPTLPDSWAVSGVTDGAAYQGGVLKFTGGANAGVAREVLDWSGGVLSLFLPSPFVPAAGDTFDVTQGCNKSTARCRDFGNIVNHRGYPLIPGADRLLWTAPLNPGGGGGGKK